MKNAYIKDILRTITRNAKRFIAIAAITALGLTAFSGISAACTDMYLAADRFYDAQQLFDIRVLSTLGLTDEDVAALLGVEGIADAHGVYSETVHITVGELRQSADMIMLSPRGLSMPYLVEGALPQQPGEVAVTQKYLDHTGKAIGDTLEIEEDVDDDESEGAAEDEPRDAADEAGDESDGEKGDKFSADIDWDAEVEIEEDVETPTFLNTQYVITGVVINPLDVASDEGTAAFRSTATTDYTFFVTQDDVDTDVYTAVDLVLRGTEELNCYSDAYESKIQAVVELIEAQIMRQRQQARYDEIMAEAMDKLTDAESTMNEKFADADKQFADAWAEVEDAKQELIDGEAELTKEEKDALQKLADARAELEDARTELNDAEEEWQQGKRELEENEQKLKEGKLTLEEKKKEAEDGFAAAEKAFADEQAKTDAARDAIAPEVAGLQAIFTVPPDDLWPQSEWDALVAAVAAKAAAMILEDIENPPDFTQAETAGALATATQAQQGALAAAVAASGVTPPGGMTIEQLAGSCAQTAMGLGIVEGGQQALNAQQGAYETQKDEAQKELAAAESEMAHNELLLKQGRTELEEGRAELDRYWADLREGEAELDTEEKKALKELKDAWQELADGKKELEEGEQELIENEEKYQDKKTQAQEELADAYAELEDIDMAQWYVQDRTSLDSYSGLDSDLSSIDAIGKAFPVLFLVVAILISLTTMTRMVEEERGLIGTFKALGYGTFAISWKYILYAALASVLGSLLGSLLGFVALPQLLIVILRVIYVIPNVPLYYDILYGAVGGILFVVSIVLATVLACRSEVRRTPASLMRPKAPRAGARIFLERIPALWNRLKFLNKVTARNLFRYKKRLFMTVVGIAGCTALVLTGFAIRDSVTDLMPKQYEHIYHYDLLVAADPDDNDDLVRYLNGDTAIADFLSIQMDSVKALNENGSSVGLQLVVIPRGESLADYINTNNMSGAPVQPNGNGVLMTQNAAGLLGLNPGDAVTIQNLQLDRAEAAVGDVVENYLGNHVFMTQETYETLFGEYKPNAAYAHFAQQVVDQPAYADRLKDEEFVISSVSTAALKEQFTTDFAILNYVIYILLVLAAGLAFVVLFTLSNTNISERSRELATIKVLGFYDNEVHSYVNKETLILTAIGIVAGLPLGYVLSRLLLAVLRMPSLVFALVIEPWSYVFAAVISFCFAILVNLITNRVLDKINMVEALKSVE